MAPQFIIIPDDSKQKQNLESGLNAFDLIPMAYQSLDADGTITTVNIRWLDKLGYQREEIIGKWFGDFLSPASQEDFKINFPKFLEAGEVHSVIFEIKRKDNTIINVSYNGKVEYDNQGSFVKTHCTFVDITDRVTAENTLIKADTELKSKIKELETLNKLMLDRETRMIELKEEVKNLQDQLQKNQKPTEE